MEVELKKKYNLFTGIAMVVGIVIGSGLFIKAHVVLTNTGGNLSKALLAWGIGGLIMVISAYTFSLIAQKVVRNNGAVDYFEAAVGTKPAYYLGWYFATIYYPLLVSIVGFVTSGFFLRLCSIEATLLVRWIVAIAFVLISFFFNIISPKLAGILQLSSTFIKLIPIVVIVIAGFVIGIFNGGFSNAFQEIVISEINEGIEVKDSFSKALIATAFSYEGWIIATSINAEMKNPKKDLPKALVIGSIIVVLAYVLYNFALSSILNGTTSIINYQDDAPIYACVRMFGNAGRYILFIALIISCYGTLNGLTMACARAMYSLSIRGEGIAPNKVNKIHPKFNISVLSSIIGLSLTALYSVIWYFSMKGYLPLGSMDELAIALVYSSYIAIYIYIMKQYKELNIVKRFIMPSLAIICALFLVLASTGLLELILYKNNTMLLEFLAFLILVMVSFGFAIYFDFKNRKRKEKEIEKGA